MPLHGRATQVWLDALDISAYLNSADFSADVDTADTTTFLATWKTAVTGQPTAKFDAQGYYDPTLTKFTPAMLVASGGLLSYGPAGMTTVGQNARMMQIANTAYGETSPVGGVVAFKWSVLADTAVGFGVVLNPISDLGASPATSAYIDGLGSTTTGWQAHLHVTAVTGAGSWVVKLQDDTVNTFASVADVSGGAFTTLAVPGQQRLVSASGATLRRYVRAIATRTGGTTGDRITFGLVIARNI